MAEATGINTLLKEKEKLTESDSVECLCLQYDQLFMHIAVTDEASLMSYVWFKAPGW